MLRRAIRGLGTRPGRRRLHGFAAGLPPGGRQGIAAAMVIREHAKRDIPDRVNLLENPIFRAEDSTWPKQ